jgi:hypothetical protein
LRRIDLQPQGAGTRADRGVINLSVLQKGAIAGESYADMSSIGL